MIQLLFSVTFWLFPVLQLLILHVGPFCSQHLMKLTRGVCVFTSECVEKLEADSNMLIKMQSKAMVHARSEKERKKYLQN